MTEDQIAIALNLGSAWAAGSVIGLERSHHGRPAGFRTHALVCLASALLMVVTSHQWTWIGSVPMDTVRTDPTRIAQGIMTGIGFLGAGVIFKDGLSVRGLTTAASIWITSAIGILYGVGMFYPAILATIATIGTLAVFRRLCRATISRFSFCDFPLIACRLKVRRVRSSRGRGSHSRTFPIGTTKPMDFSSIG
jgi:putative Mg2+ transporter-C (MgtC) family protein